MTPAAPSCGADRLREFLRTFSVLVDEIPPEDELLERGAAALHDLISYDDWLDAEFAAPHPDHYQQYLLYCDPQARFSVVSFVWGPGQQTPIHDHTIWGLVGVLRGGEQNELYDLRDGKPELIGASTLNPGDVAKISQTLGDVHKVRNAYADRVSISIHVYGGDIGATPRHIYLEDGARKTFISAYSNKRLPNPWGAV